MNGKIRVGIAAAALGIGFAMAPTAASAVQQAPTAVKADTGAKNAAACSAVPDRGWVLFYQHSDCQGAYQGWTTCGRHFFTGPMKMQASSYWDNQYGGAYVYADVTDDYGHFAFRTWPGTGVRNVATGENDRSYAAWLNC